MLQVEGRLPGFLLEVVVDPVEEERMGAPLPARTVEVHDSRPNQ